MLQSLRSGGGRWASSFVVTLVLLQLSSTASLEPACDHDGFPSRHLLSVSLSPPAHPGIPSPYPPPQAGILIQNETDFAQHITAAKGPNTTILLLPAAITLTRALPPVTEPLQLLSNSRTIVTCASSNFTALTVNTSSFGMEGLTWVGCGTVLVLEALPSGTDSIVLISKCSFQGNSLDPAAVSDSL